MTVRFAALPPPQDKTYCKQMSLVPVYEKGLLLFRDSVVRAPGIAGRFKMIMLDNVRRYDKQRTQATGSRSHGGWTAAPATLRLLRSIAELLTCFVASCPVRRLSARSASASAR